MTNVNPTTGIRYGVISFNSLQPWCSQDLFYGDKAVDLSWQEAVAELKREGLRQYEQLLEECCAAAAESGADREVDFDQEAFEEKWFAERKEPWDRDDFIDDFVERNAEHIQIDEPIIEGECDGVKYRISWLGGAPLLWVLEGPHITKADLCSPCVPNAGSLDSINPEGFKCYDVPETWRWCDGGDS